MVKLEYVISSVVSNEREIYILIFLNKILIQFLLKALLGC